ncbi:MAG: hypothetical protein ACI8QZ_002931 [Chlamydiales bacterium]|jgi:hypothetical protein
MSTAHQPTPDSAAAAGKDGEDARGLLARHLLPTLLHGINNHTQFLTGLHAVLSLTGGGRVLHDRADDLAQTARDVEDAGWLLALVASGNGANLMLARREPRGLEIVAVCVDEALRRVAAARPLACAERSWPRVAPAALDGWQLPWCLGSLLLAAGLDAPDAESFDWALSPVGEGAQFVLPRSARVEQLVPLISELLDGAQVGVEGEQLKLGLPAGWLQFAGPCA